LDVRQKKMAILIIILFLLLTTGLAFTGFAIAATGSHLPRIASVLYFISFAVAIGGGIWSTYYYDYFSNPNTHYHGWPIPHVVFQRDNTESEWRDYVGPTIFLALPINWILFLFPPSVVIVATYLIRKKKKK